MKALTIYQPWASLIAWEVKPYEFRGWDYASRYHTLQGCRLAIHSSARPVRYKEILDLVERMKGNRVGPAGSLGGTGLVPGALPLLEKILAGMEGKDWDGTAPTLPLSAIVAVATLGRAVRADTLFKGHANDSDRDDHALFAWPMIAVKQVPPVPCRGAQGFWNVPASIERDLG